MKVKLSNKIKESLTPDSCCLLQVVQSFFQKTNSGFPIFKDCWLWIIDFFIKKSIKNRYNDINLTNSIAYIKKNTYLTFLKHKLKSWSKSVSIIQQFLSLVAICYLLSFEIQNLAPSVFLYLENPSAKKNCPALSYFSILLYIMLNKTQKFSLHQFFKIFVIEWWCSFFRRKQLIWAIVITFSIVVGWNFDQFYIRFRNQGGIQDRRHYISWCKYFVLYQISIW